MRISILIPVYNVASYLPDCLASIDAAIESAHATEPFELIFINDASTDGSMAILEQWCEKHAFARIVSHSENRGLAQARTTGIRAAQGEYVAWVDSDDTVTPDWFRVIVKALDSKADIIAFEQNFVGHPYEVSPASYGRDVLRMKEAQFVPVAAYADWVLTTQSVGGYCWNKVIRRELLANGYDAPRGAIEDFGAMLDVLPQVKTVYYIPEPLVNYYYRSSGLLATFDGARRLLHYKYIMSKMRRLPEWLKPSAEYSVSDLQMHINRISPEHESYALLRRTLWRRICDKRVGLRHKIASVFDAFALTGHLHTMFVRRRYSNYGAEL